MVVMRPGAAARAREGWRWLREGEERDDESLLGVVWADSVDGQTRPPKWLERKDRTILGQPVLPTDWDENYWEVKYAKELHIGAERFEKKKYEWEMEQHDMIGTYRNIMRQLGWWKYDKTSEQLTKEATAEYEKRIAIARSDETQKKLDWNNFVAALESDKPLITVAKDYRNVYDCYGVDDCLDSAPSMLWITAKVGAFIGLFQGGFRAVKVMQVDAAFLNASGMGVLSFVNVAVLAGMMKWGGNLFMACGAFLIGDRLVREAKRFSLPPSVEPVRSPANYAVGLAGSFSLAGVLPWWLLNDKAMAARLAVSSGIVGAGFGYCVGLGMQRLIALNLNRLEYNPSQFRAYQGLMKREKAYVEDEKLRMKKIQRAKVDQGLIPT